MIEVFAFSRLSFRALLVSVLFALPLLTGSSSGFHLFFVKKMFRSITGVNPASRKEVFQPHLPVRLPCYDLAPVTGFTLGRSLRLHTSGTPSFHGLTGGVYKARERIHRVIADTRLLANPTSRGRVADLNPNCEWL